MPPLQTDRVRLICTVNAAAEAAALEAGDSDDERSVMDWTASGCSSSPWRDGAATLMSERQVHCSSWVCITAYAQIVTRPLA
eukprot:COSAG01_NODE_1956_length_8813_cov_9.237434_1_plen_82_part_00